MNEEVVQVPVDEAIRRLAIIDDYDDGGGGGPRPCVHTFAQSAFGLLGAHWGVGELRAVIEAHGVEESGPEATAMRHGLVVIRPDLGPLFLETREEAA